jgi:hypothetical protein
MTQSQRTGAWQPYIPRIGVSSGARTGPARHEVFSINHTADKFADHKVRPRQQLPTAARSSLNSGCQQDDNYLETPKAHRRIAPHQSSSISLSIGRTSEEVFPRRTRPSRLTESSISFAALEPVPRESPQLDLCRGRQRGVEESLKPPDNLGPGLDPLTGEVAIKPVPPAKNISSLGSGLLPVCNDDEEPPLNFTDSDDELPTTYSRLYGN